MLTFYKTFTEVTVPKSNESTNSTTSAYSVDFPEGANTFHAYRQMVSNPISQRSQSAAMTKWKIAHPR